MSRSPLRRLGQLRSQEGMTLVELSVAMALLGIVSVIFLSVLVSVQRGVERQTDRSGTNDQARLAIEQLDHEIRSGNLLYDPALETDAANGIFPGMSLRVYTQTNASIRTPGNQCVQWRILNARLETRYWGTDWRSNPGTLVSSWQIVATGVVNQTATPPVPAFALDPDPSKAGRTIVVTLLMNVDASSGSDVAIRQSVTGRNTQYGYPNDVCADIPPY